MYLSIIVPVYNVESYLDRCLESLVEQDFQDYEVIVINDASTDKSYEKAKKWANNYNCIKLINKPSNSGLSDTRNVGLEHASGEYVLFVDSDDYVDKNSLRILVQELDSNTPDILYFGYSVESESKKTIIYNYKSEPNRLYDNFVFAKNELASRNVPIPACVACYKRSLIEDNKLYFYTGILHEDVRWSPQIMIKAKRVYTSKLCFYHYILRNDSISQKKDRTQNGIDLLLTCDYLMDFSKSIAEKKLRKDFVNYVAMTYMKSVAVNEMCDKKKNVSIRRTFPICHVNNFIDYLKASLFMLSPLFYTMIYVKIIQVSKGNKL